MSKFSSENYNTMISMFCGSISGFVACFLTQPFDVIKTMIQLYPENFSTVRKSAQIIYEVKYLKIIIL